MKQLFFPSEKSSQEGEIGKGLTGAESWRCSAGEAHPSVMRQRPEDGYKYFPNSWRLCVPVSQEDNGTDGMEPPPHGPVPASGQLCCVQESQQLYLN